MGTDTTPVTLNQGVHLFKLLEESGMNKDQFQKLIESGTLPDFLKGLALCEKFPERNVIRGLFGLAPVMPQLMQISQQAVIDQRLGGISFTAEERRESFFAACRQRNVVLTEKTKHFFTSDLFLIYLSESTCGAGLSFTALTPVDFAQEEICLWSHFRRRVKRVIDVTAVNSSHDLNVKGGLMDKVMFQLTYLRASTYLSEGIVF